MLSATDPLEPGSPALSANGTIACSSVHFSVNPMTLGPDYLAKLHAAMAPASAHGIEVQHGGDLDQLTRPSSSDKRSEIVGFAVALVVLLVETSDHALLVGTVVPASDPQSASTTTLFIRLVGSTVPGARRGTGARAYVTGSTASQVQFVATIASRLALVIAIVVVAAFLLITATFRSVLLAVKAAVLNLLSIGAACGGVVAVFQWGWWHSRRLDRVLPHVETEGAE